tara:strand:+ start:851 stop:1045 length:195 start_codon:yes stop_codon:yes gene_type:complete
VKAREAARSAAAPAELPPPPQRQREKKKSKQRGNSKVFLQLVKVFNFFHMTEYFTKLMPNFNDY